MPSDEDVIDEDEDGIDDDEDDDEDEDDDGTELEDKEEVVGLKTASNSLFI
jgi:hypothetical protein